jgi:2-polyprenyl-6-methoxyphenol hydroxylase-like FAD-dependent oxidoreductase
MRVIVGAGPCGTALALLLARRGFDVIVLEQENRFDRVFRGEALMPGDVGVIAQMERCHFPWDVAWFSTPLPPEQWDG